MNFYERREGVRVQVNMLANAMYFMVIKSLCLLLPAFHSLYELNLE